jgi:hydroxylaminobenzene mutase
MSQPSNVLCFTGVLLFLLGLLNGFAIPRLRSPRLGLSAHLTGVQSGTFLIAAGLLWPKLALAPAWSGGLANALWVSLYAVWLSLLLAGVFGAGHGLPIAGQGMTTSVLRQRSVTVLLALGSLGCTGAVIAVLVLWRWSA